MKVVLGKGYDACPSARISFRLGCHYFHHGHRYCDGDGGLKDDWTAWACVGDASCDPRGHHA